MPGRRIGTVLRATWTLERLLGSSDTAALYVARHQSGRRDAIKILHPHIAAEPGLRARFDQEARVASRFVHPAAVQIRGADVSEDGCPFLVMELLDGESLRARCERLGPLELAEVLRIADELADVLAAAHAQGIVHRDLEPDNVLCLRDGRIKVRGFGVARIREGLSRDPTRAVTTLGTLPYMAPEQVQGSAIDARVDLFALGAAMFWLVAGRPVHEAPSDAELAIKMATQPAPPLASVAPGTPQSVSAIVDRALAFDREARYPHATAMRRDLRAVRKAFPVAAAAVPVSGQPAFVDQDAATRLMSARPLLTAPAAPALAPVTPKRTKLTALTYWTATTVGERKLRWAALALPVVAAGVLALVFYGVTRVDQPASSSVAASNKGPAAPLSTVASPQAPIAAVTPAAEVKPPERVPRPEQLINCFLTNSCERACEDQCELECMSRSGCTFGVVHDATVQCKGPELSVVSCAGKCTIKSQHGAPILVHCTPGFDCEIEDCPRTVERCSPLLLACGSSCPG